MSHRIQDETGLEIARRVVAKLRESPSLLEIARSNLSSWSERNASDPSLLQCYEEWRQILARPLPEICEILCSETDLGQRLRQNSPFAGVLSAAEVWSIKAEIRKKYAEGAA